MIGAGWFRFKFSPLFVGSVIVWNGSADNLYKVGVLDHSSRAGAYVRFPKYLINFSRTELLSPSSQNMLQFLCRNNPLPFRIRCLKRLQYFIRHFLHLIMRMHHLQKISEGHFASLVLQIFLQLCDSGAHPQRSHYQAELIQSPNTAIPRVQVEAFSELVNVLLPKESRHFH